MNKKKIGLVVAGSKGIGKSIFRNLSKLKNFNIQRTNSKTLDTSNLTNVKNYVKKIKKLDLLVLNTGGPPAKNFYEISEEEFMKYHQQLYYSFVYFLQKIKINNGGYVFLISSSILKEPPENMVLSNSYRLAFLSAFKVFAKINAKNDISCISLAPGAIKTDRLKKLVKKLKKFEKTLPGRKLGNPNEIGVFVKFIVQNKIKYLNGAHIHFDGAISKFIF